MAHKKGGIKEETNAFIKENVRCFRVGEVSFFFTLQKWQYLTV